MNNIISLNKVSKRFGKNTAVDDISFDVPQSSIFAYLGSNGAGKTTTLQMMLNLIKPNAGEISIMGKPARSLNVNDFQRIGYLSCNQKIPEWMRVEQLLKYCEGMYEKWDNDFCKKLTKEFALNPKAKIKTLSTGEKARLKLICSIVFRPELLIMDEPFNGLDVAVKDDIIRGLLEITEEAGWTIVIASHEIDEIETIVEHVAIIDAGKLHFNCSTEDLSERIRKVKLKLKGDAPLLSYLPSTWLNLKQEGSHVVYLDTDYSLESEHTARDFFKSIDTIDYHSIDLKELCIQLFRSKGSLS